MRIVADVEREGLAASSLDELGFASNARFADDAKRAVEYLRPLKLGDVEPEYASGFDHCIPINPSLMAAEYPWIYLWGLDEQLLDLVENLLGLPPAYHGVILRKEITNEQEMGTRFWHLDSEDQEVVRVTMYLTDVLEDHDGPFEYVPRDLSPSYSQFADFADEITDARMAEVVPKSHWKRCLGPAQTTIVTKTTEIFHHGRLPQSERIAASWYYTSRNPSDEILCREYSFEQGLSQLEAPLTRRQYECLWEYQPLLPPTSLPNS